MGTVREKPEMELDQGSVEQIRKLFNDYVVDPLGKELKEAESQIKSDEATQMGTLKNDLETKLDGTNGRLEDVLRALGIPKNHWQICRVNWMTLGRNLRMILRTSSPPRTRRWKTA